MNLKVYYTYLSFYYGYFTDNFIYHFILYSKVMLLNSVLMIAAHTNAPKCSQGYLRNGETGGSVPRRQVYHFILIGQFRH